MLKYLNKCSYEINVYRQRRIRNIPAPIILRSGDRVIPGRNMVPYRLKVNQDGIIVWRMSEWKDIFEECVCLRRNRRSPRTWNGLKVSRRICLITLKSKSITESNLELVVRKLHFASIRIRCSFRSTTLMHERGFSQTTDRFCDSLQSHSMDDFGSGIFVILTLPSLIVGDGGTTNAEPILWDDEVHCTSRTIQFVQFAVMVEFVFCLFPSFELN